MTDDRHIPVMVDDVVAALAPTDGETFVDGTYGAGGYSRCLLQAADCRVWAIDRDRQAIEAGQAMVAEFAGRLSLLEGRFAEMDVLLAAHGIARVDGVALDLGVSSMQLDDAERGFSLQHDGPLDMRMGPSGPTAADIVNGMDEAPLADLIYRYGDERRSRAVARAIVKARQAAPIERTLQLAEIVSRVVRSAGRLHPATRTFQALRIYVNDELTQLSDGLGAAERLLSPEGRLAVVSFHSLEDRTVKRFLDARSGVADRGSRHLPPNAVDPRPPTFRLPTRRARKPREAEIQRNPRARSARLRVAVRTDAPAWMDQPAPTREVAG